MARPVVLLPQSHIARPVLLLVIVTLTYNLGAMAYYLTAENAFNKQPTPYGANGGNSGVPGLFCGFVPGDDAIGRYYTMGVRLRM
jgi:outer membrane receptor protein involved in Fe transport